MKYYSHTFFDFDFEVVFHSSSPPTAFPSERSLIDHRHIVRRFNSATLDDFATFDWLLTMPHVFDGSRYC